MLFANKERRDALIIDERTGQASIPPKAHHHGVNGETLLEWLIFCYKTAVDRRIGSVTNANDWFADPGDLGSTLGRIIHFNVENAKIANPLCNSCGNLEGNERRGQ